MLIIRILATFTLCTFFIFPTLFSQDNGEKTSVKMEAIAPPSDPQNRYAVLQEAVKKLATDTALRHGQVGIVVVDVTTGETLAAHNAEMSLIPASNMKIVSSAAALGILGKDYRYKTELQYDGYFRDSILYGNLYVKGSGDPTLGSPDMDSIPRWQAILDTFAVAVKTLGIKSIVGKIVGDGSAFEQQTAVTTWQWEDLGNYYGVGANGLTFHDNFYKLHFQLNPTVGTTPSVNNTEPFVPEFILDNQVKTAKGGGDNSSIYTAPYAREALIEGTLPAGNRNFTVTGALPDPPFMLAWHLRRTLREQGVPVSDSATTVFQLQKRGFEDQPRRVFFRWLSPTLADIVKLANLESQNMYCETFLKTVALEKSGLGSTARGVEDVLTFWRSKGINTDGLFMQDGSGLSSRNGITPNQLANMLRVVAADNAWFLPFYNSLPAAQSVSTGTFRSMFKNTPSVWGRLRAKSGTIRRVKAYSGYMTTLDGRLLAFSAMCNNFTCSSREMSKRLEQFMVEIGQF